MRRKNFRVKNIGKEKKRKKEKKKKKKKKKRKKIILEKEVNRQKV